MALNNEAIAALVYLILYAILFVILILGYTTRRLELKSRYSTITFHVFVRLASQATGLAFGIIGYSNIRLLVAYFILGAEGYFTLVLCTYRFLISWQTHNSNAHDSWLEPKHPPGTTGWQKFKHAFDIFGEGGKRPMSIIHWILIGANAVIISGGSMLANINNYTDPNKIRSTLRTARATGQGIFLGITIFLLYCIVSTIVQCKRERGGTIHPTLKILLCVWPLLFTRGIYGVLAGVLTAFNYWSPTNYGPDGLTHSFLASEYVLSTTMEWSACALLMLTWVTSRHEVDIADGVEEKQEKETR
jgi:hypothetical protein